jgi:hypothetical protein
MQSTPVGTVVISADATPVVSPPESEEDAEQRVNPRASPIPSVTMAQWFDRVVMSPSL